MRRPRTEPTAAPAHILSDAEMADATVDWLAGRVRELIAHVGGRKPTKRQRATANELLGRLKVAKTDLEKFCE